MLFLYILNVISLDIIVRNMKAFGPKWVNYILDIIGVSSLRLGDLHIHVNTYINFIINNLRLIGTHVKSKIGSF